MLLISMFFIIGFILLFNSNKEKIIYTNSKSEQIINSNVLTMMYETEVDSGEYQVSSAALWPQEGYIFNEQLSSCENGSTLTWDDENKRVIMSTSVSDKCYVYFDKEPLTLADYIINEVYTGTDGENGLYYHDGVGTYGNQEAGDNSYRYSGASDIVNNYVCFGSDEEVCSSDNLYRIIGVFNSQVKLIKSTKYNYRSYIWDVDNVNTWDGSTKPDIYATLNTTYYNTIPAEWQNLIAETTWQVGGMAWSDTNIVKQYYAEEVGTGQNGYEETMKIGLMYVSDYGYAADPSNWTLPLVEYGNETTIISNNWLYVQDTEWTISRDSSRTNIAFYVDGGSGFGRGTCNIMFVVRPSFYLESGITYVSGDGSIDFPFRIQ